MRIIIIPMELELNFRDPQGGGIRSDFLNPAHYKATLQFSQKRYQNYIRFCKVIQKYYEDLQGMSKVVIEKMKTPASSGLLTVNQLKSFLLAFMGILQEVAVFKIGFYEELENMQEDPVKKPTYELLANTSRYDEAQAKYKDVNEKLRKAEENVQIEFNALKRETKEPVLYFDYKYTQAKCKAIQQLIDSRAEMQKEGNSLLDTIYGNAERFEKELMFYRQKILSGKYKIHSKLGEMARGARQCLIETLLALIEELRMKQQGFSKMQRESTKEASLYEKFERQNQKQSGNANITEIIIQATQEYHLLIDDLEAVLKIITESFNRVGSTIKERQQVSKSIVEQFNKLYETDENPTPDIIQTLQLFCYFCQKMSEIPNRIHVLEGNLNRLRQNITKHSEITLSLVRCGTNMQKSRGEKGLDQISHLFQQLSYDFLNDIIHKIYKDFEDCLGNIKNHFNAKFYKKRKNNIQDSMQISHIEQAAPYVHKKPSKKEQWIWKQFRNSEKYHKIEDAFQNKKQILKAIKTFSEIKVEQQKQIQKYNLSLKFKKQTKGVLRILQKSLQFTSSNNLINLRVPYDYIEEVVAGVNIFEKQLTVKTSIGNIIFPTFPEISRAQVLIQQQINLQAATKKTVKKASVELTEEQKKFIETRNAKLASERISTEGMQQLGCVLLQNTTVDALYDIVYSDKPFKYKGKEESMFMCHAAKKSGASNYMTTPYAPPGPKFYTLEEGRTFVNTPLYSQRTSNYEVPLPPIPFMPKTCQNAEQVRLYWISNTQFDYFIRSDSSGAPAADTFFLNFYHRVVQKDKNVQITVYFKCTFVKDTALKGMITSKSMDQAKDKNGLLLKEIEKVMKSAGGEAAGQQAKNQNKNKEEEQQSISKSRSSVKVKKLENQNKILIGVLVGVILLNLLLRWF